MKPTGEDAWAQELSAEHFGSESGDLPDKGYLAWAAELISGAVSFFLVIEMASPRHLLVPISRDARGKQ